MSTVQNLDVKGSNWNSLETLENSRYKTKKSPTLGSGSRPTVKTLKQLDILTSNEDKVIRETGLKADNDVRGFIDRIVQEESEVKRNNSIKSKVDSLNREEVENEEVNQFYSVATQRSLVKENDSVIRDRQLERQNQKEMAKPEPIHKVIKEIFLGFGRLYINKTNNILNPLRFVMENKLVVARAILLFIIPALMTWYFTTQVVSIQMELAKESILIKSMYAVIFYFASMFVLFTTLIANSAIWNSLKESVRNAQKVGKKN